MLNSEKAITQSVGDAVARGGNCSRPSSALYEYRTFDLLAALDAWRGQFTCLCLLIPLPVSVLNPLSSSENYHFTGTY